MNGIFIKTWISDPNDSCLFDLAPLLVRIKKYPDVRDAIREMHDKKDA